MFVRALLIAIVCLTSVGACDKPSHENVEKWANTQKGTGKLESAFKDENLDADLSAHAGAVLIKKGLDPDVRSALEQMSPARRTAVVAKLAPRLWELARIEGDLQLPNPTQVRAKDALVLVRKSADDATKKQIDGYLVDWYCVGSYEARATAGAVQGASVVRLLGSAAAKKLLHVAEGILALNAGNATKKNRLGDELLLALAVTGDPETVKYLLELTAKPVSKDKGDDPTLPTRAMSALYKAYVDPGGLFDLVPSTGLVPNVEAIAAIAKNEAVSADAADDAVRLLRVVGSPQCIAPLVAMVGYPHSNPKFKYVAADSALKCGGLPAAKDVVKALPDGPYRQDELVGGVVVDITLMTPRAQVLQTFRDLLAEKGRIPRWVAIEGLAAMKSTEDIPRLQAVNSGEKLVGYWGDQSGVDPKDRKPEPTLGQRAKELAARLGPPLK
ncbi:MAG TPA: hypothetical protein VIV58_11080 [Kofleriaceae bacterium]